MTMLESVFGLTDSRGIFVEEIKLSQLVPYENQPFKLYTEDKLDELVTDIERNGLLNPILVRELKRGKYQILAGHNRVNAFKKLNKETIPAIVKEVNDNEAKLILVQSNLLQRQELSNAEKAMAYKMRNEALKSQGKRGSGNSLETIAQDSNDSKRTIARYIKSTELITELFNAFDDNEFSLPVAEQLASLSKETQNKIVEQLLPKNVKMKADLVEQIKQMEEENQVDFSILEINPKKKPEKTLDLNDLSESLDGQVSLENIKLIVDKLVEQGILKNIKVI